MQIGRTKMNVKSLIICGIVRDCAKGIRRNRPVIDKLCSMIQDPKVVLFENDSKDDTKILLQQWADDCDYVHVECDDFNTITIPSSHEVSGVNPSFSAKRINKMAHYRNQYLEYIKNNNMVADYVLVVDLDLKKIDIEGIIHSLSIADTWDVVAANGIIYSPSTFFRRRYNDTFALVEKGEENLPQTEQSIKEKQYKWAHLKKGMPLQPVYSAFGGLAIYRFDSIKDCRYSVLKNNDPKVEVRCEHFALCQQMHEKGYNRIFINPAMKVVYGSYGLERFWTKLCKG